MSAVRTATGIFVGAPHGVPRMPTPHQVPPPSVGAEGAAFPPRFFVAPIRCLSYAQDRAMPDLKTIVHSDPDIHSGDPVFVGTRVPVRTLLDYIEGGDSLEVFLDNFPSVTREQAVAFLEEAARAALAQIA